MTTDADKIDNLLAQRRELMDKIEEQIDERGRIIERIQSAPDSPIARLRARHQRWIDPQPDRATDTCTKCPEAWPCDTIAALDALEAGLHELLDARPTRGQLFQRLDAATELIRQAMATVHILHFVRQPDSWHDLAKPDIDACPDCAPFREWLAGDKEDGLETMKSELAQLRAYWTKHRAVGRPTPDVGWEELDVLLAALDALEVEGRDIQFRMFELQTRLDAATELIRQAMKERHYSIRPNTGDSETRCGSPLGTSIDTCEHCRPFRAWLAGDEEAGNGTD